MCGKKETSCCIELLSPAKMRIWGRAPREATWKVEYEQILGVPYPFNRYNDELQAFQLVGNRYQAMIDGRKDLDARFRTGLFTMAGRYRGALTQWLRWYDAPGLPRKQR